jgi:hypothetical protein
LKKNKYGYLLLLSLLLGVTLLPAQPAATIRFKRTGELIFFFQQGPQSDTIFRTRHHRFYLLVPDSLKPQITLEVENGRLMPATNDSIVEFSHMKGLKYESLYLAGEDTPGVRRLNTLVNGASSLPEHQIRIRILHRKTERPLLENPFIYSD